jgi:predicted lipase
LVKWIGKGALCRSLYYDDGHGRQGFLAADSEKAILCFRGTESSDIHDLLDDIKICPTSYQGAKVHRGFLSAALSLWEPHGTSAGIASDLKQLTHHKLYVAGHSLGAAMAVITGMTHEFEQIVTFGEPRVGKDIKLFGGVDDSKHIRFVNGKDIVTSIIPAMPAYAHHGIEKHIPLIDGHEFFIGSLLDHSILHYVYQIDVSDQGFKTSNPAAR